MGFLKKLFGGTDGIRESMHDSYNKHFRIAEKAPGAAGEFPPHYSGLYGALGTRYLTRGVSFSEVSLFSELAPFLAMGETESGDVNLIGESEAVSALAEYMVYQESPEDERATPSAYRLEIWVNAALQICSDERKMQAAVAFTQGVGWASLIHEETAQMLSNAYNKFTQIENNTHQ